MKRIIVIVLSLSCILCEAQVMSFMGIPMGANIESFKHKLLTKNGFTDHPLPYENIYAVDGIFAGKRAAISIATTPKSKLVYQVLVAFTDVNYYEYEHDAAQKKELQENLFEQIRLKLITKYGNPTQNTISYDCYLKWCFWETNEGRIDLMIYKPIDAALYRRLQVIYEDGITSQRNTSEEDADW